MKLKIEYAINIKGHIICQSDAFVGEKYYCPHCKEKVVFKKGFEKRSHFSHISTNKCNRLLISKETAKNLIVQGINNFIRQLDKPPVLKRKCSSCGIIRDQEIPTNINTCLDVDLRSGLRVDIGIFRNEALVAAIILFFSKKDYFSEHSLVKIPYIALNVDDVIRNPLTWEPLVDHFKPISCKNC